MGVSEKLEVGKRYLLRNGFKTNKLRLSNCGTNYSFESPILFKSGEKTGYLFSWLDNGSYLTRGKEHRFDIVKEIENER